MKHEMKLEDCFFNYIKSGTKRIEIRLNDAKRSLVKKGDVIRFRNIDSDDYLDVIVDELLYFENFQELINQVEIELIADKSFNKDKLLSELNRIYSLSKQERYGVVGIKFSV